MGRKPIDLELSFRLNHPESTVCCDVVIQEHMDVLCLVVLAGIGALLTEVFEYDTPLNLIMLKRLCLFCLLLCLPLRPYLLLEHTIFTASSYIEVVGFVPAVWTLGNACSAPLPQSFFAT